MAEKATMTAEEIEAARLAYTQGVPPEVAEAMAAAAAEYGEWVAVDAIYVGGARAHNPGDAVPKANVKAHKWDELGLVARAGTKAAKAAGEGE